MKGNKARLDNCEFAGLEKQLTSTQFVKGNLRRHLSDEDNVELPLWQGSNQGYGHLPPLFKPVNGVRGRNEGTFK